jgi:hypothetical protein
MMLLQHDRVLYSKKHGFFFVETRLACDMKALKALMGIKSGANVSNACLFCDCTTALLGKHKCQHHVDGHAAADVDGAAAAAADVDWTEFWTYRVDYIPVLCIPIERVRLCAMHCVHRVGEKMLHLLSTLIWESENMNNGIEFLKLLNDQNINGGKCVLEQIKKQGDGVGKIPLNGTDHTHLLTLWPELVQSATRHVHHAQKQAKTTQLLDLGDVRTRSCC